MSSQRLEKKVLTSKYASQEADEAVNKSRKQTLLETLWGAEQDRPRNQNHPY